MKNSIKLFVFILSLLINLNVANANLYNEKKIELTNDPYKTLWDEIEKLEKKGLPKSALLKVQKIYKKAQSEHNTNQIIKSCLYKYKYNSLLEEESIIYNLQEISNDIAAAHNPEKQILHSLRAKMYWNYYEHNRYKVLEKIPLNDTLINDITNWDIQKIIRAVDKEFKASLLQNEITKKIQIEKYSEFITIGNEPLNLRPTLYDFLAHNALDFYTNNESQFPKNAHSFIISDSSYFTNATNFLNIKIAKTDTNDFKYKSLNIFQQLLNFRLADNNLAALIDLELKRFEYLYDYGNFSNKDQLYLRQLQEIIKLHPENSLIVKVHFLIAKFHQKLGASYIPLVEPKKRWDLSIAHKICKKMIEKYPKNYYIKDIKVLLNELEAKNITFTLEKTNIPFTPFKALVSYKNVTKIYIKSFKILNHNNKNLLKINNKRNDYIKQLLNEFKDTKSSYFLNATLPQQKDLQTHSCELALPALPPGDYIQFASTDSLFNSTQSVILTNFIKISNIAFLFKTSKQGDLEFIVTNRKTGAPLSKVQIQASFKFYNDKSKEEVIKKIFYTDSIGYFKILAEDKDMAASLEFIKNGDTLKTQNDFFITSEYDEFFYIQKIQAEKKEDVLKTYFFTDRAIYRPGQTIYFKGIQIIAKSEETYELQKNKNINVKLYDVNSKIIAEVQLTTNNFGSYTSSFQLPFTALSGPMRLSDGVGDFYFYVEEYKRPSFEVVFSKILHSYKLGDTIHLSGNVQYFSGAQAIGCSIKYTISREAVNPIIYDYRKEIYPNSQALDIIKGESMSDIKGDFKIKFLAIPDLGLSKKLVKEYTYKVIAEVTDAIGETQTQDFSFSVGYNSTNITIEIPEIVDIKNLNEFIVSSFNFNGNAAMSQINCKIFKLENPEELITKRVWSQPDTFLYSKEEFKKIYPNDPYLAEPNDTLLKKTSKIFEKFILINGTKKIEIEDKKNFSQGKYVIEIEGKDSSGEEIKKVQYFTVTDFLSNSIPFKTVDFIHVKKNRLSPGENLEWSIASSEKIFCLYEVFKDSRLISSKWITLHNEKINISMPILDEHMGGIEIQLNYIYRNRNYSHQFPIEVNYSPKNLEINFESFRSKLQPGEKETWKIHIKEKNSGNNAAEMVATLYDASLDKFETHQYQFELYPPSRMEPTWESSKSFKVKMADVFQDKWNKYLPEETHTYNDLKLFGFDLNNINRYMLRKDGIANREIEVNKYKSESEEIALAEMTITDSTSPSIKIISLNTTEKVHSFKSRKNFQETAFYYPQLETNKDGKLNINFTIPESLTKWKLLGFAHTQDLKYGLITKELITQKELMVTVNTPRFIREGDEILLQSKIINLTNKELNGATELHFFDTFTDRNIDSLVKHSLQKQKFVLSKEGMTTQGWRIKVPEGIQSITYKIKSDAGTYIDGEENSLPILSNKILLTETFPFDVLSFEKKKFSWNKFITEKSNSLVNHKFTLEYTSNPLWYVAYAIPTIIVKNPQSAEEFFYNYYATTLASVTINSFPELKKVFKHEGKNSQIFTSKFEKNEELKNILLEETPWVMEAKEEQENFKNITLTYDSNNISYQQHQAIMKLSGLQSNSGGWPWFKGMNDDAQVTTSIITGLGNLEEIGIKRMYETSQILNKGLAFLDNELRKVYLENKKISKNERGKADFLTEFLIGYYYSRSLFKDIPLPKNCIEAYDYLKVTALKEWPKQNIHNKALLALTFLRNDNNLIVQEIVKSIKEYAMYDTIGGMYFKNQETWNYSQNETQALLIRVFAEIKDQSSVEKLTNWLVKQKQAQNWKSSKATAEVCYTLLKNGELKLNATKSPQIFVGKKLLDTASHIGPGYIKSNWSGKEISSNFGNISIQSYSHGISYGSMFWQYLENLEKITKSKLSISIEKKLLISKSSSLDKNLFIIDSAHPIHIGDLIIVRLEINADRDIEYVHIKDQRSSGLEPTTVLSGYNYKNGLGYYSESKDAATHFYIDKLPKGKHFIEYALRANVEGVFSNGIATLQSMYVPEYSAHTTSQSLKIILK